MNNLIFRAFAGFVFLMSLLGLALFLSAGSIDYWQGWVYLANFGLCAILITAYLIRYDRTLLEGRVRAGAIAETRRSQQVIQSVGSLIFIALYVVSGLDYRFRWSNVPLFIVVIGNIFIALSFYAIFRVFRENSFGSYTIEVSDEQKVITTGPYSIVRHPMYAGAIPLLLFTPIALGSWVGVPLAVPAILTLVVRLFDEEKFLLANLPGYAEYYQKVRYRLIPFVW